ncbi:MAG: DUF4388 domain-containing protein [Syntrophobacterales bacterium]|jgi:hypothetical protein
MPLNGDVKTFPLAAVVQMIHEERKTGALMVNTVRRRCIIYFRGGKIIHVSGNTDKELKLGTLLRANNLIDEDRLEDMVAVAKAMEKRLGSVLLERAYIDADKLASILHLQVREMVTTMFNWDDAKFSYKDGLDGLVEEDVKCEVDPVRLITESKRMGEFKGVIPNDHVVFQINPSVDSTKSVHAARELRVLLLLDGRRSVADVIKETGYSRLAVYRSLAKLHAQNAIARKGAEKQPVKAAATGGPELHTVVGLYWSLLQLIMTDVGAELGNKKAASSLENSLRRSPYYEGFLKAFQLDQDQATNAGRIQGLLAQQGKASSLEDCIKGFHQVVAGLLHEQYQFLGYKATRSTVQRLRATLEKVPANQGPLARIISRLLEPYENEAALREQKKVASGPQIGRSGTAGQGIQPLKVDNVASGAIVQLYNEMFRIVLTDLEREVGAKAHSLFEKIIGSSKHRGVLFNQFQMKSTSGADALKTLEKIKTAELKLSKSDLVQALQDILGGLLLEESQLLGPKATDVTISRLMERTAAAQSQLKPLTDYLSASLKAEKAKMG